MHLVQDDQDIWRWFFGRDRVFVDERIGRFSRQDSESDVVESEVRMSSIYGSFLDKDREIQDALSKPRLILASVVTAPGGQQSDKDLKNVVGLSDSEFQTAIQLLADEGLVTARPAQGGLMIVATGQGKKLAGS